MAARMTGRRLEKRKIENVFEEDKFSLRRGYGSNSYAEINARKNFGHR
jgi:hypothetical protein